MTTKAEKGILASTERCDPDVFKDGRAVCYFAAPQKATEAWVRKVAADSGQHVDWSYVGGRAVVKFLGRRSAVVRAVNKLRTELRCEAFCFVAS